MARKLNNILVLVCIALLFSCGGSNNEYYEMIRKTDDGLRGAFIGDNIDQVKQVENEKFLKSEKPDYLHYDYPVSMGNSYTVAYDFSEENKLYEIELTVFFDVIEDAQTLFLDFEEQFNRQYGKSKKADDDFTIWNMNNDNVNAEIAMINDSQAYGYLSIIIRDLDY
ncbi:MAG: hypothetical protein P1U41_08280 [Vicingaceae bacterium]|nr:hypothetical protein [Vicingaceae bacterium]